MQDTVLGIVRHTLTTAGGGLVAKGVITASVLDQGIGALITLAGLIWSVVVKRKTQE